MKTNLPLFLTLPHEEQKAIIEALIFAANADEILTAQNIFAIVISDDNAQVINKSKTKQQDSANTDENAVNQAMESISRETGFSIADIEKIIEEINVELDNSARPYRIVNYAGGYQFATVPQYGEFVYRMLKSKTRKRFSTAQLETLAIIAYKQPVTKQEIDKIRGVTSSGEIVNVLMERQLVKSAGYKDILGKPMLYETTTDFLKTFGLNSLADLPKLREIEEIAEQKLREEEEQKTDLVLNITQEDIERLGTSIPTEFQNQ